MLVFLKASLFWELRGAGLSPFLFLFVLLIRISYVCSLGFQDSIFQFFNFSIFQFFNFSISREKMTLIEPITRMKGANGFLNIY